VFAALVELCVVLVASWFVTLRIHELSKAPGV